MIRRKVFSPTLKFQSWQQDRKKPQASKLRTAGILAGGLGLAYGGVKMGQAAGAVKRTAEAGEAAARRSAAAAENMRAITQGIRKTGAVVTAPFRKVGTAAARVGRIFGLRFGSLRKDGVVNFASSRPAVAQHRYVKQIKEADTEKTATNYTRSAVAGAGLGLALRGAGVTRKSAALLGAVGGVTTQHAVRTVTAKTKDAFGDRSAKGKLADNLTSTAIGAGALVAGQARLRKQVGSVQQGARRLGKQFLGGVRRVGRGLPGAVADVGRSALGFSVPSARRGKAIMHGTALAGGIAAADAVTSAVFPGNRESRTDAAKHGVAKGAVYGTALALAEPALMSALRKTARGGRGLSRQFAARGSVINFGGWQQLRDGDNRFVDPLQVASGEKTAYHKDEKGVSHPTNLPVAHAQVVRAAVNKGKTIQRYGSRAGGLARDAVGALKGEQKTDSRGRPVKREWEKSWFKNAVGSAVIGAGLLGHAAIMKRNPGYRAKVGRTIGAAKARVNRVIPDAFPGQFARGRKSGVGSRPISFDVTAPDWDVRDQRGRSARVFAPGARPRDRREKKWHEKVGNIRKVALIGALAAAAGGGAIGYRLGRRASVAPLKPAAVSNIIQMPKVG